MSRPSNEQRLAAKHAFFLSDYDKIQSATREVRVQCLADRRFCWIPGAQWEGAVGEQFENKPRFEFNKVALAVLRVINEYRNNRITVDFVAKDGSGADDLADTMDGLFRADEQDSGGQDGYDNCFEEGTTGGMGAIRLQARYEDDSDDEDTRQRISIKPIHEADSTVFFSLDGKEFDKSDAKRCYVLNSMAPADYEEEWGDNSTTWPKDITQASFDWCTPDVVWVAEVYEIEEKTELVHFFRGLALGDDEPDEMEVADKELQDDPNKQAELEARGFRKMREKRRKVRKVHKYIMSGGRILSDEGYIAGTCIPIVPFYGKRMFIDGIERYQGHVRLARDAQVLDNMIKSWLAEMASRFDIEKPVVTPEMIAGHAQMWADDAIQKYPYLLLNSLTDPQGGPSQLPVLQYTKAPNMPPAMAALAQLAATALEDMLGNQAAGEQLQPNQSGKAVELIQQRLDMQTFIYIDNFKKTIKRVGEVWQSMAKELLVEPGRKMKTVSQADQTGTIELLKPMIDEESGASYLSNDLSRAKFDVVPDVGPSSISRKAATVRGLINILQMVVDPQDQKIITSQIMMNMEGEGMGDMRAYYRQQLVRMGVIEPNEEEKKALAAEQQNQKPDPQAEYLQAAAAKAQADADSARKNGVLTDAKVALAHADTIATLAGVEQGREAHAFDLAMKLDQATQPAAQDQPQATPEMPQ
jgi:hypothetical protein